ncbi:B3 domain-containing protein Os07g0563300-like isoform X2 [Mangifera indica]|uniref:B3 domain-containing protein Os07g0563300-like isoform X2 n=1 Tax=Mangifera indica TaxID=29780 RepID=UPI001CF9752C|nr:B3 domain-containing protein Os07g0563300-like isoform X2 [Mangifera indica]XP_044473509.1 B3 domain-containing protein Os07g0563300-like isoform X2 [Mangifera indica]XP_044473511.1 B3 domain-containing protein Os07g0563300-like isoform X2 [Mangifera indica]
MTTLPYDAKLDLGVDFWTVALHIPTKIHFQGILNTLPRSRVKLRKRLASMNRMCFYCKVVSATLWPGWRLRNGSSALLCNHCVSAYEEGIFCYIFHWDASGWRDCVTCKKMVHCGCIMSTHTHTELDFGGVRCTECISNDMLMGANSCRSKFKNACPMTLRDLPEVRLSLDLGKVITGITDGTPSQEDAHSCENREQLHTDSPDVVDVSESSTINKQPQSDGPRKIHSYRKYLPEASDEDLEQIQKHSNSSVIPLFEKELTSSDADPKNGRLVIPKKCAQDYLPTISEPQGVPIKIQDTGGKYWNFRYRFWPNNNSTMYALEGTRDYLAVNQCQPGDKVAFYRIEPEGQLVLGLKKAQASTSDLESSK